jgi:hypothetical protein
MVAMASDQVRWPNFAVLIGLAWLAIVAELLLQGWADTAWTLPDADDALRLSEVRNFLAGQGWFDLHESRLGLAAGYDSHWSRLIDAGLAGLFFAFRPFADVSLAERLTVTVAPMLWLIPTLIGAVAIGWRLAGREAALIVLLLAIFDLPGLQQFRAGRIDHHNVQIALAMLAVAAIVWSDRMRWAAAAAGVVTGISLAIGFEALPIHVLCGGALVLRFVTDRDAAPALGGYGAALAAVTLAAFLISVGPDHWLRSVCDEIAINSAAAVIVAGLGVTGVSHFPSRHRSRRFTTIAIIGVAAALVFAIAEPRCLGGPYAMVDPAIRPIWLGRVTEFQPLLALAQKAPLTGVAMAAFPALALIAALMVALKRERRRDFGNLAAAAAFLLALATMIGAIKGYSYAVWLGTPFVAAAALRLFAWLRLYSLVPRFIAALLITPTVVTAGAMTIASAAGTEGLIDPNSPARQSCVRKDNYAALAQLPPGRVVANELEWGPYILAWTPHAVLAGPYHRLSRAILASHQALAVPPDEARKVLAQAQVDYIVLCGTRGPFGVTGVALKASLWGRLQADAVPRWLTPVPQSSNSSVTVYRLAAQASVR